MGTFLTLPDWVELVLVKHSCVVCFWRPYSVRLNIFSGCCGSFFSRRPHPIHSFVGPTVAYAVCPLAQLSKHYLSIRFAHHTPRLLINATCDCQATQERNEVGSTHCCGRIGVGEQFGWRDLLIARQAAVSRTDAITVKALCLRHSSLG
jgi:hypothetical protein